jgi:hypothetical protein
VWSATTPASSSSRVSQRGSSEDAVARTKAVTREALAALGAEALADLLIAHAATDPTLRKKLGMLLAGTEGPGKLAAEIDKRIKTIGRSRSFVDWEKRKPLVHELDHLRVTIATRLARQDAARATDQHAGFSNWHNLPLLDL